MKLYFNMDGKPMSFDKVTKLTVDNGAGQVEVDWGGDKRMWACNVTIDALNGAWPKENKDDKSL